MKSKLLLCFLAGSLTAVLSAAESPAPIKPLGTDGQPLNLGFETGTLKDWTTTGDAFDKQPIKGDAVAARRKDMKSGHAGDYWIGGFDGGGDTPTGTLTSVPFKVTQPWASFLMAAGASEKSRVEVVLKDGAKDKVIFKITGVDEENLKRAVVDLQPYQGKEIFVRLVDEGKGGWNHVNFDDFVFHTAKPQFAAAQLAKLPNLLPVDEVKFSGLSAEQAAKEFTMPKGFKATLFAGEPDVVQPVAFAIDDRGRLWVAEYMTYPKRKGTPPSPIAADGKPTKEQLADIFGSNDRILVFEDTDGDGKFDKRTVFLDKLNLVSGLEVGFGGVYIGAAPYLMFVPVKDWDNPTPAGDPQILLDGWDFARDTHEVLNTFHWGPDGWLYGCHGVFCPSNVGKPGTPKAERQWVDAAVWRYHPTKHQFEVFAEGTSNPWGVDFDENGQCIIEACVIPHLFHMIQGGKYQRQGGSHYAANADEMKRFAAHKDGKSDKTINPYVYGEIKTIADHAHFRGGQWTERDRATSFDLGGGHAHAGMLVYQGDSFPAEYRGKLFMNNIHGQRINMDIPVRSGSGFVGQHGKDFINFNDRWSQIIDLRTGPDGSVFMIDWYDKNQCHLNDVNAHDRSNGRIFKVSYDDKKEEASDRRLADNLLKLRNGSPLPDNMVANYLLHPNEWYASHAQRILQEKALAGTLQPEARQMMRGFLTLGPLDYIGPKWMKHTDAGAVRLLWALHVTGGISDEETMKLLKMNQHREMIRAWLIQLSCEDKAPSDALLTEFARMAREDKSPVVRLYLASALQRLPVEKRGEILEGLLAHAEDAKDQNLPLMYWYAAEPVAGQSVASAAKLLAKTKIPQVREYITRRMTAGTK